MAKTKEIKDTTGFVFGLWQRYYKKTKNIIIEKHLVDDWRQTMYLIVEELKASNIKDQIKASSLVQSLFRSQFFNAYGFERRNNIWQHIEVPLSDKSKRGKTWDADKIVKKQEKIKSQ